MEAGVLRGVRTYGRMALLAGVLCSPVSGAWAQTTPGQTLPGGISAADALALYQTLTPEQRKMLATNPPKNPASMTPAEAMTWYQSMTPQQKQIAKDLARQQFGNDEGLKAQIKAWIKAFLGK